MSPNGITTMLKRGRGRQGLYFYNCHCNNNGNTVSRIFASPRTYQTTTARNTNMNYNSKNNSNYYNQYSNRSNQRTKNSKQNASTDYGGYVVALFGIGGGAISAVIMAQG